MKRRQWLDDHIGARFGSLLVLSAEQIQDANGYNVTFARVRCDCGSERHVVPASLKKGRTSSCGEPGCKHGSTHGKSGSSEHATWSQMRQRCTNPNHPKFGDYGGRGIGVCWRWESFANFYADMGPRPPGMSLDRKDNDGDYEPSNCRWATVRRQQNNRRPNVVLEHRGVRMTVAEWSRRLGIDDRTLRNRIYRGWSVERALSEPVQARRAP